MNFSPLKIIENHLYLLQLENYDLKRFGRVFWQLGFKVLPMRQSLAWTEKLKAILIVALLIQFVFSALIFVLAQTITFSISISIVIFLIILLLSSWLFGIWAAAATAILLPLDLFLKKRVIKQAKDKLNKHKNLKIIGVTGSYGKTTMKEVVAAVLSQKYNVLKTKENKNTPLGIAHLILAELTDDIEMLVVEMGAYQKGDIKNLCALTPPDVSILTGINESHLERFGSMENTIAAKFEIVKYASDKAKIILNADNDLVMKYYQDYVGDKKTVFYSAYNHKFCDYRVIDRQFLVDLLCQRADIMHKNDSVGSIKISFLGEYIFGDVIAAIMVAREFHISTEMIRHALMELKPIDHRLKPIKGENNILVIDDSYNGSIDGVEEAIRVLAHFKNRRKIYITPGLVETGDESHGIHYRIGKRLSKACDLVVLIKNSVTSYIEKGLLDSGFAKENILFFENANEAHQKIQELTKSGDVVLFQNDWPDNYV